MPPSPRSPRSTKDSFAVASSRVGRVWPPQTALTSPSPQQCPAVSTTCGWMKTPLQMELLSQSSVVTWTEPSHSPGSLVVHCTRSSTRQPRARRRLAAGLAGGRAVRATHVGRPLTTPRLCTGADDARAARAQRQAGRSIISSERRTARVVRSSECSVSIS